MKTKAAVNWAIGLMALVVISWGSVILVEYMGKPLSQEEARAQIETLGYRGPEVDIWATMAAAGDYGLPPKVIQNPLPPDHPNYWEASEADMARHQRDMTAWLESMPTSYRDQTFTIWDQQRQKREDFDRIWPEHERAGVGPMINVWGPMVESGAYPPPPNAPPAVPVGHPEYATYLQAKKDTNVAMQAWYDGMPEPWKSQTSRLTAQLARSQ